MNLTYPNEADVIGTPLRPLRGLSMHELLRLISHGPEADALFELLQYRRLFHFYGKDGPLLLPEYLYEIRSHWAHRSGHVAANTLDYAYDLTLDKFMALPSIKTGTDQGNIDHDEADPKRRVDCRHYYAALLKNIEADGCCCSATGALMQDHIVAVRFQRYLNHHFFLSCQEAWRKANPFVSRYNWRVDGRGTITVCMPKYLKGWARRAWLEKHVDNADPKRPGERERIQGIINERMAIPNFMPFDPQRDMAYPSGFPAPDVQADRRTRPSFTQYLAREKALSADLQRPAIRKLGPENIERLVNVVVPNLATRERTDEDIAREFGLSKTAHCHFCGTQRHKDKKTGKTVISDLWRNAAELLSQVEAFRDAAAEAGVLKAVVTIMNQDDPARLRRTHDVQ